MLTKGQLAYKRVVDRQHQETKAWFEERLRTSRSIADALEACDEFVFRTIHRLHPEGSPYHNADFTAEVSQLSGEMYDIDPGLHTLGVMNVVVGMDPQTRSHPLLLQVVAEVLRSQRYYCYAHALSTGEYMVLADHLRARALGEPCTCHGGTDG